MTTTIKIASQLIHEIVSTRKSLYTEILLWFNLLLIYGTWLTAVCAQQTSATSAAHMRGKLRFNLLPIDCEWDLMFISFFTKFNITIADKGRRERIERKIGIFQLARQQLRTVFSVWKAKERGKNANGLMLFWHIGQLVNGSVIFQRKINSSRLREKSHGKLFPFRPREDFSLSLTLL